MGEAVVAFKGFMRNRYYDEQISFLEDGRVLRFMLDEGKPIASGLGSAVHDYGRWRWGTVWGIKDGVEYVGEQVVMQQRHLGSHDGWLTPKIYGIDLEPNAYESWLARKVVT